jgi:opacity protein-like surface antigen
MPSDVQRLPVPSAQNHLFTVSRSNSLVARVRRVRRVRTVALAFALFLAGTTTPALAQTTPDAETIGYGVDVGVLFPDATFDKTFALDAHGEYYLSPKLAIRGLVGFANPGVRRVGDDRFRQVKLLVSGVYNWTYNDWRPFVAAGAGAYFVRVLRDRLPDLDGETRGGLNLGAGTEFVLSENHALKGEARWDIVSHPTNLADATGLTLTVGYKRYF